MTLFLGNVAGVSADTMANVQNLLSGYFNQVVSGQSTTFTGVQIVTAPPSASSSDLLCYIVPSFASSALVKWNSNLSHSAGDAGNTMFTTDQKQAASEVYMDVITGLASSLPLAMANLIFHECMHNKTATGDALHNGADGLAKQTVSESDTLTSGNIATLQAVLGNAVTQWTGGF